MKKAIVFFGGVIENYFKLKETINNECDVFCADGGAEHAKLLNIIPKLIIGDFDSISPNTKEFFRNRTEFIEFSQEKDFTDGELIIEKIYNDYETIIVYGAFGGEHHHLLGNIFLLEKYPKIRLVNDFEEIFYLNKYNIFENKLGVTVSFIPIDKINNISLKGFKYNLDNREVKRGETITVSNIIVNSTAIAKINLGSFLGIIQNHL